MEYNRRFERVAKGPTGPFPFGGIIGSVTHSNRQSTLEVESWI